MRVIIMNTGKIASAEIEIKGISVIAGLNNTGKSTVGKVLFCIFNSYYNIERQIEQERKNIISRLIATNYRESTDKWTIRFDSDELADYIIKRKEAYVNHDTLRTDLRDLFIQVDESFEKRVKDDFLPIITERLMQVLIVSDEEIFEVVFRRRLQAEFSMQINNLLLPDSHSEIRLIIKNEEVKASIFENELIKIENQLSLNTEAIYIDNPLALDESRGPTYRYSNHREHLKTKLFAHGEDSPVKDALGEIITTKKLEVVFSKLNKVYNGELSRRQNSPRFYVSYKENDTDIALDARNVSTGLKTFVILKTLLMNGSLEENGIIILDEPEIHLHPEWQLIFAEIIVLLHKEFNLHILLNTHSPYFLDAIEVYSHKHEITKKCKYYLAEENKGIATIKDVSANLEMIYEKLARPLQDLEDMRYPDDSN